MAKSKLMKVNEKIAEGVVSGYKKIEEGVVGAYEKVENAFVDRYLTHEGETVEDAKKRLAEERATREQATAGKYGAIPQMYTEGANIGKASVEASREIGKASLDASKKAGKHQ